ncbi:hypothetical protein [Cyanobium sp. Aljojuca 7D2]|uniref:hypothetical protein n=1 Tax=Cyanobium sp. Aljojuca 7D2 TaxID=2823698 RepID=UPI0020CF9D2B|nr:hypothetical protein [Cyanobium sp. Aljojuca 7D2]
MQVGSVEGTLALLIGLNSKRRNTILDVRVQAVWKHAGVAGLTEYEPLPLQLPDGLPLQEQLTLVHRLDPQRPLQGREGALLISFSGVDATLERPIHAAHLYEASQILWRELPPTPLASPAPSL